MNKKAFGAGTAIICLMTASTVFAAQGVIGDWEFKSQMPGMSFSATMAITKDADGKYSGTWSAQWGESTLSDITFEKNVLKFVQTSDFGGQEMKTTNEATLDGKTIKGKGKNQFGESIIEGTLQGEAKTGADAIMGTWELNIMVPVREIVDKLAVTKNADGNLSGNWVSQRGENTISNMKFEAGKLTFTRSGKMGAMEFTSTFAGTVEGDKIKGAFTNDFGEIPITATRVGAAKSAEKSEPNKPATSKPESKPEPNKPK